MIKEIKAREILDSRGNPTVEVELATDSGKFLASVPSGTSKGKYEAVELRDGGERYMGMGVLSAVKNVNEIIAPKLKSKDPVQQKEIDEIMLGLDDTPDKSRLGVNAILGVSLAVCRAGAGQKKMPLWQWISKMAGTQPSLPVPCILYIEGGLHGRGSLDVQEIMAFVRAGSFKERLRLGTELYHSLAAILSKKYGKIATNVGLEGGFSPSIQYLEEALDLLMKAAKKTGNKINIILDVAASTFFQNNKYYFEGEILSKRELLGFYLEICKKYPVKALEDPFAQDDWQSWQELGSGVLRIGDDLTVTNLERMKQAKEKKACGGVVIKPNQIGTITETLEAVKYAVKNKWKVFIKHRSGETKDDFIADLAVGLGGGWIMAGAPARGERVAKYNRLIKIEKEIKQKNG
jgi:enolase